jgi:hypothetical protein
VGVSFQVLSLLSVICVRYLMAIWELISISYWMSRTFILSFFKAFDGLGMV